jgi:hypothetical protein
MDWDVFISHASEDKQDVVRPLAEQLKKHGLKIWVDEFELRLGDSLRQKIDIGLSKSKYGIVVLSPSFFQKDWPQKELDGLVAREKDSQKIILPIWHKLNVDDVVKYSPLLSGRLAAKWEEGVEEIAKKVLMAINFPLPPKTSSTKSILEKALALDKNLGFREEYEQWQHSETGVNAADESVQKIFSAIDKTANEISAQSKKLQFTIEYNGKRNFVINAANVCLVINWTVTYANSLNESGLSARLYKGNITFKPAFYFDQPQLLSEFRFDVDLMPNRSIIWKGNTHSHNAESLADFLFEKLLDQIQKTQPN